MDIFNEISWPQFTQLNEIRVLPLNEQVNRYNQYLNELQSNRQLYLQQINWIESSGGGKNKETVQNVSYLLQENGFEILQENGYKIIIT